MKILVPAVALVAALAARAPAAAQTEARTGVQAGDLAGRHRAAAHHERRAACQVQVYGVGVGAHVLALTGGCRIRSWSCRSNGRFWRRHRAARCRASIPPTRTRRPTVGSR